MTNDFLVVIQLLRSYVFVTIAIVFSKFFSPKSDRITKMLSLKNDMGFAFKCIMSKYPYLFLIYLTGISSVVLGLIMQIVEGPVHEVLQVSSDSVVYNDYTSLLNCLWNIYIIITTVGYGDYFPVTTLGRIFTVITSFTGIVLVSIIIMNLQNSVQMDENESKAIEFLHRVIARIDIRNGAANYFKTTLKFLVARSKYIHYLNEEDSSKARKGKMKAKKELENWLYTRIKEKKTLRKSLLEFHNTFESLNQPDLINDRIVQLDEESVELVKRNISMEKKLKSICIKLGFMTEGKN